VALGIVVAVIAILAAVLIPTFSNLIKKANLSSDQVAVRNMNNALAMDEAVNGKPVDLLDAMKRMQENGYDFDSYKPLTEGYRFFWNSEANKVVLAQAQVNEKDETVYVITYPADLANTEFDATHPAVFCFGTSKKDAYVMMNVFSGNKLLESKTMNLSDTIVHFKYPYQESYGDGVLVSFCMVRDGQVYQEQARLKKRLPDKTLTMKWEVFRDKLRPGQKEEWKLTIKTPQGQAAEAEMLATMYDASLDKIWNRKQNFSVFYNQMQRLFPVTLKCGR